MLVQLAILSLITATAPAGVQVRATPEPGRVEVIASLAEVGAAKPSTTDATKLLSFGLVDEHSNKPQASLLGEYRVDGVALIFAPRYKLVAGNLYRAQLTLPDGRSWQADYRAPSERTGEPAHVTAIYPSSDRVPANLLKFYIEFSRPMREGPAIFDRIQLLDAAGQPLDSPWRLTELWSDDARRLTLYIHPGRIKSGVNLREELGAVLRPDQKYTLVVLHNVLDAEGQPLADVQRKTFTTTAEIHNQIDVAAWKVSPPRLTTREPFVVEFDKSLDCQLARRCLKVLNSAGTIVTGQVAVSRSEQVWSFVPEVNWTSDEYTLVVDPVLEDQAGNTPVRVFDTDLRAAAPQTPNLRLQIRAK